MAETPDAGEQTPDVSEASSEAVGLPLLKTLVAAIAIVGLTTGAFWLIGDTGEEDIVVAGDTDDPTGQAEEADEPDEAEEADEAEEQDGLEPDPEPDEAEGGEPEDADRESDDVGEPTDADEADGANGDQADADGNANGEEDPNDGSDADANGDTEEADGEPEPADEPGSEQDDGQDDSGEADESPEPAADAVDPATVSVQVLDGYQDDGGSAAAQAADDIEGAGYNVIARNVALRSEATSVLYNPGNEEAAQQLAAEINAPDVRPQPGNLSTDVDLHVVVGFGGR